jgi:hypothetical protein
MKKYLLPAMMLFIVFNSFGQANQQPTLLKADDYLYKSKRLRTTGWTIFGIGTTAITGGLIIANAHIDDPIDDIEAAFSGGFLIASGALMDLVSIPFFAGASINKTRARKLRTSIRYEDIAPEVGMVCHQNAVPAIAVKYRF